MVKTPKRPIPTNVADLVSKPSDMILPEREDNATGKGQFWRLRFG